MVLYIYPFCSRLAKTSGAMVFGVANALVPVAMAACLTDLSGVSWGIAIPAVLLVAVLGLNTPAKAQTATRRNGVVGRPGRATPMNARPTLSQPKQIRAFRTRRFRGTAGGFFSVPCMTTRSLHRVPLLSK